MHTVFAEINAPGAWFLEATKKIPKIRRFHVLPPLKNHPSKSIGFMYSPLWKSHPPKPIGFVYSPLWKNHPSKAIGFMYSPLWKTTHGYPLVLYAPLKFFRQRHLTFMMFHEKMMKALSQRWTRVLIIYGVHTWSYLYMFRWVCGRKKPLTVGCVQYYDGLSRYKSQQLPLTVLVLHKPAAAIA